MSNTYGTNLKIQIGGTSHGEALTVDIQGLPIGTPIDTAYIQRVSDLRAPGKDAFSSSRKEPDKVIFESGVTNGRVSDTHIKASIANTDVRRTDYAKLATVPRPSHADYPSMVRYGDSVDLSGGGPYSGRMTAPFCIIGGIVLPLLAQKGIHIGTHIFSVGDVFDTPFDPIQDGEKDIQLMETVSEKRFAVIDKAAQEAMQDTILAVKKSGDSIGGIIEGKITGLPVGLGEPMFDGIENVLAKALFAIPAVKAVEFGSGFAGSSMTGSAYNDAYHVTQDGHVRTLTNHAGGIVGGMATGMPVLFKAGFKPTPSIGKEQKSVNLATGENVTLKIDGRHDPCIVPRACVAVRCVSAMAVFDMCMNDINFLK